MATPGEKRALSERIKELHCLYDISRLFSERTLKIETLLKEIVKVIPGAWQYPERTCVRICHGGREYRSKNYAPGSTSLTETIRTKSRDVTFVEVAYTDDDSSLPVPVFLEDEEKLLKAIARLLGSIIEKKEAELLLKRSTAELHRQTVELEHKNIALKEIVSQIEQEKKTLQDQMRMNIELMVMPLISKMRNPDTPPDAMQSYLRVVQENLADIASPFTRDVVKDQVRLSPRELEICNLIRNGLASKEIAQLLQISLLTVERHRHNVRRKLRIDNERINLATFLRGL